MRVLVTGATGFIGRHMCPALRAAGHEVSVAVRRKDFPAMPEAAAFHVVPDIGPKTDWTEALTGAEAVVHLAARAHVTEETAADPVAEYHRVNAEGTASLAAAAAAAGVRRVVFLSSSKAAGERTEDRPFSESDPPKPEDAYGISKWDGEKALLDIASQSGLEAVILRPPLVYGPGVKGNFLSLLKLCRLAPPLPFSAVNNRRSFIYVGNLANAAVHCLGAEEAAGETYFVRDGEDMSTPDLIRRLAQAMGRPARLFPVPAGALRLAALVTGKSAVMARVVANLQVDDGKIRRQLGWTPPSDVVKGLNETAAWFASGKMP